MSVMFWLNIGRGRKPYSASIHNDWRILSAEAKVSGCHCVSSTLSHR